jgi:hypothetical protein
MAEASRSRWSLTVSQQVDKVITGTERAHRTPASSPSNLTHIGM